MLLALALAYSVGWWSGVVTTAWLAALYDRPARSDPRRVLAEADRVVQEAGGV